MVALLLSFLINEKIGPIFFVFGGINYFLNRKKMDLYFVVVPSLISIISYLVLIKIVPLDNFPSQMDFLSYPYRFVQSFRSVFTGQGITLPFYIPSLNVFVEKYFGTKVDIV